MIIRKRNVSGLLTKWYTEVQASIIRRQRILQHNYQDQVHVLDMNDVQTAFYLLGIGLLISSVVLAIEMCVTTRDLPWDNERYNLLF